MGPIKFKSMLIEKQFTGSLHPPGPLLQQLRAPGPRTE